MVHELGLFVRVVGHDLVANILAFVVSALVGTAFELVDMASVFVVGKAFVL